MKYPVFLLCTLISCSTAFNQGIQFDDEADLVQVEKRSLSMSELKKVTMTLIKSSDHYIDRAALYDLESHAQVSYDQEHNLSLHEGEIDAILLQRQTSSRSKLTIEGKAYDIVYTDNAGLTARNGCQDVYIAYSNKMMLVAHCYGDKKVCVDSVVLLRKYLIDSGY